MADELHLPKDTTKDGKEQVKRAKARVAADQKSARASGVMITPTFFINGRRYDGPWDESSFADAMLGRLGHRVRAAALDFATWAPSAGILLLIAAVLAVILTNSRLGSRLPGLLGADFRLAARRAELRACRSSIGSMTGC